MFAGWKPACSGQGDCVRFAGFFLYENGNSITFLSKVHPEGIPVVATWTTLADALQNPKTPKRETIVL